MPVHGQLVPFHIMAVKSVTVTQDAGHAFIRINFNAPTAPGATAANATYPANVKFPDLTFLREVSYRSSDTKHANYIVPAGDARVETERVSARDGEGGARDARAPGAAGAVARQGAPPRRLVDAADVRGRGGRKAGTLEAHTNGLRYVGAKADEQVDVIYSNIKFAFFQPAKKELKTLIHFHLHDAIMIGKKKTKDVQFYMEIMEAVQSLDGGRRNMYDPDEIEEEQARPQKRIHKEFSGFCHQGAGHLGEGLPQARPRVRLPVPRPRVRRRPVQVHREDSPHGDVPASSFTEYPSLVISAEDIEVVNLERVGFHLKNFDMAIIFKDFSRDVHRIDQIPVQNLDNIKQWLALDIKYYEGKSNLNWKPLLKQIKEDPDEWLESGGWEFLNNEIDDEDEEGEEAESESDFAPSDSEEEESESESESESMVESEEDDEDGDEELSTRAWTGTSSRRKPWPPTRRRPIPTRSESERKSDPRTDARSEGGERSAVHRKRV